MHAPGKRLDDHLVQVARQRPDIPVVNFNGIQCECSVRSSQVFMDFGPRSEKHAPYLHLLGEVREVRFPKSMQPHLYGVDALTFAEGTGLQTDIFYKFSSEELVDLVKKGYFEKGFEIPDILVDNDFDLPMSCNLTMIEPQRQEDPPIIFVGLDNPRNMEFTAETSGYELSSYFEPAKSLSTEAQAAIAADNEFISDAEYGSFDDTENLFHVEMPAVSIPEPQPADDYEDDADNFSDIEDIEPEEEDEAAMLLRKYASISEGVGARKSASRADIDRQLRKATGRHVEEPVVAEPVMVDEPVSDLQDEVSEPVVTSHTDDDKGSRKSAAAAQKARVAELNQEANDEVTPKQPRQVPAGLSDIADQADAEFVSSNDFGDEI